MSGAPISIPRARDKRYGAAVHGSFWEFVAGLRSGGTVLSATLLGAVQGILGVALPALEGVIH
jgi:hypothetical protein